MKKILIKIGNISNLSEDRNQLEIPFDGKGKYNYQHFIDWLERIGRPYSVEWSETIMKNIYSLSYEQEIFIKYGELIEVNEIIELNNNKKLPLKNTILIKA